MLVLHVEGGLTMAEIYKTGLIGAAQFRSYDITPRQAIIFGRRGSELEINASLAGSYIYQNLTGRNVAEGRQFLDYENTQGMSVLKLLPEIQTEINTNGTLILNASAQWNTSATAGRRYIRILMMDWNTKTELYNFGIQTGEPNGQRLNLAQTVIVTPSAFSTSPKNQIVPVLQFYGLEGDNVINWGFTGIYQ